MFVWMVTVLLKISRHLCEPAFSWTSIGKWALLQVRFLMAKRGYGITARARTLTLSNGCNSYKSFVF
jgi:hypothetical protein